MENLMPKFDVKSYDVTNYNEFCGSCVVSTLVMELNEVVLKKKNCIWRKKQRRPYAQLSSVETYKMNCDICIVLSTDMFPAMIDPKGNAHGGLTSGCGCDTEKMEEVAKELRQRMEG